MIAEKRVGQDDGGVAIASDTPAIRLGLLDSERTPAGCPGRDVLDVRGVILLHVISRRPDSHHEVDVRLAVSWNARLDVRQMRLRRRDAHRILDRRQRLRGDGSRREQRDRQRNEGRDGSVLD